MNLLKTFESRVSDAFGAAPQGYAAPISFKKLAKRAAREMEAETYEIDGVDTAPALITILVASADDATMRPLYGQLTSEVVSFVEAKAQEKRYVFVGKPLARFMVDPSLKSGKFAVFAENVDARTLARLRQEEEAFINGSAGVGGAAARPQEIGAKVSHVRQRELVPIPEQIPGAAQVITDGEVLTAGSHMAVPATQLRTPAHAAPVPTATDPFGDEPEPAAPANPKFLIIDRQSGRTYSGTAPVAVVGRERSQAHIVLHDPNVSRKHAELRFDGQNWHIHDLRSTNGTLVNDVDVDECILKDGDLLTVGLMNLEFREN
jgi:hypothetical protein